MFSTLGAFWRFERLHAHTHTPLGAVAFFYALLSRIHCLNLMDPNTTRLANIPRLKNFNHGLLSLQHQGFLGFCQDGTSMPSGEGRGGEGRGGEGGEGRGGEEGRRGKKRNGW